MRILITNGQLRHRTGTEIVVRDLAVNLRRRGHTPMVFAQRLGQTAYELRSEDFLVTDQLADIAATPPDIIHGHHDTPTALALTAFPGCPAIWICHSRAAFDRPPRFRRILRYIAVDVPRRDHLVRVHGIPPADTEILHNAVDLLRIPPRPEPLPERASRALVFAKTFGEVPLLSAACQSAGLSFDGIGIGVGRPTSEPEQFLVAADIVFATGRAAIESLCAGSAVIVGDLRGLSGLVTTSNYNAMRNLNFGGPSLFRPFTSPNIVGEIGRYSRSDAVTVSERIRVDADINRLIDRLEALYAEAIAKRKTPGWTEADSAEVQRFLAEWPADRSDEPEARMQLMTLLARNNATIARR